MTRRGGAAAGLLLALLGLLVPGLARAVDMPGGLSAQVAAAHTAVVEVSADTRSAVLSARDDATATTGLTGPGTVPPATALALVAGLMAVALATVTARVSRTVEGHRGRAPPALRVA